MGWSGQLWSRQNLHERGGDSQVFLRRDFDVHRRAGNDRDFLAEPLDELRVVSRRLTAAASIGIDQKLSAKDLRRLSFPQILAGDRFLDGLVPRGPLDGAVDRRGKDRRAGLDRSGKN